MTPRQEAEFKNMDNVRPSLNILEVIYPVGSIYIGTTATCPLADIGFGTWERVSAGKALWTGNGNNAGGTIDAGLPNITGEFRSAYVLSQASKCIGAISRYSSDDTGGHYGNTESTTWGYGFKFDASKGGSNLYGKSSTVQPPAFVVNVWRRTA